MRILLVLFMVLLTGCELFQGPNPLGSVTHIAIALDYRNTEANTLGGTINDAVELEAVFRQRYTPHTFSSNLLLQTERAEQQSIPTRERVLHLLHEVGSTMGEEDLLILSYSGHGLEDGSWVLAPPDGRTIFLEDGTVDPAILLSVDKLFSTLSSLCGSVLLLIDSCYAGNFVQEDGNSINLVYPHQILRDAYRTYFSASSIHPRMFVLAATTRDNTSKEPLFGPHRHGYFTSALLEGLGWDEGKMCVKADRCEVSIDELYAYICAHQRFPTGGHNPALYQHPVASGSAMTLYLP